MSAEQPKEHSQEFARMFPYPHRVYDYGRNGNKCVARILLYFVLFCFLRKFYEKDLPGHNEFHGILTCKYDLIYVVETNVVYSKGFVCIHKTV